MAELKVDSTNLLLAQLAATELMNDQIFLGDVILQRPYSMRFDSTSSAQVIQAALVVPGGFGAVLWDSEDFAILHATPQFESEAILQFTPFGQCGPAIKALLVSQLEPLMESLIQAIAKI